MTVYKVKAEGLGTTVVFDDLDEALDEVRMHVQEEVKKVTIFTVEMTEKEFAKIKEHEGY
jgi:hypothetical protein